MQLHALSDGPSFKSDGSIKMHYVLLGDPLSLVCGRDQDSNPQATITWTAPDGTTVVNNARYYLAENGPEFARLNLVCTDRNDKGVWTCGIKCDIRETCRKQSRWKTDFRRRNYCWLSDSTLIFVIIISELILNTQACSLM